MGKQVGWTLPGRGQVDVTSLPQLCPSLPNWPPSKSWRVGDRGHFLAASAWAAKSASFWAARNRARSLWKAASSSERRSFTTQMPRERADAMMEWTTEDRARPAGRRRYPELWHRRSPTRASVAPGLPVLSLCAGPPSQSQKLPSGSRKQWVGQFWFQMPCQASQKSW